MATPNNTVHGQFFGKAALVVGPSAVPKSGSFIIAGRSECYGNFTVDVKTTGSPASYSVQIEGSLDNVSWYLIGTAITSDGINNRSVGGVNFPFIRGNVTAVSGGTSPTITMNWVAIA